MKNKMEILNIIRYHTNRIYGKQKECMNDNNFTRVGEPEFTLVIIQKNSSLNFKVLKVVQFEVSQGVGRQRLGCGRWKVVW